MVGCPGKTDVEACILLDSALVGVHNIQILVERGLDVPSWLGSFVNFLLSEDDYMAPHSFHDS